MSLNSNRGNHRSDEVIEYILTREPEEIENLSVKSIARDLNVDRRQLWRLFKREKKISLETYIFRVKIIEAAILLRNNDSLTVTEISEKVGYCTCDYFIRVFKKYFGTTPGRYRELKKMTNVSSQNHKNCHNTG